MSETQSAPVVERGDALRGAALATAGLAAAGLLSARSAQAQTTTYVPAVIYFSALGPGSPQVQVPNVSTNFATPSIDVQVVNYALTLETLEAELYRQAVARLTTGGTDMFGNTITGLNATQTDPDVAAISEFAIVERQHQALLTGVLGNNWVLDAKARFDFGFADTNNFGTPALTRPQTQQLVYGAELTGVSAYTGAISAFTSFGIKNFLTTAAAIAGTEARHTAYLAAILSGPPFTTPATAPMYNENNALDFPLDPDHVLYQNSIIKFADGTLPYGGVIPAKTGPNGFQGKGFAFVPAT